MLIHEFVGLFLILMGFLVKKFPILIAGYNTMPADEKAKVDVDGLSSHMRNSMVVIGLLMIIITRLSIFLELSISPLFIIGGTILPGTLYMVIGSQRYMKKVNQRMSKTGMIIGVVVISVSAVLVTVLIFTGSRSPQFEVTGNQLNISGMYGLETKVSSVKLLEELPTIKMKTNGFSLGENKRGNFNLEEFGQCKLFIESMTGPFIYIETSEKPIIVSTKSRAKTEELLVELQQNLKQ
tara:strand:- start:1718 stop:2431 length:714 start_codon:yes stop_codon:yes gene_type:complete